MIFQKQLDPKSIFADPRKNQHTRNPTIKSKPDRRGQKSRPIPIAHITPLNPPTTYTNNNGHVLCIDIQTDR